MSDRRRPSDELEDLLKVFERAGNGKWPIWRHEWEPPLKRAIKRVRRLERAHDLERQDRLAFWVWHGLGIAIITAIFLVILAARWPQIL